MLSKHTHSPWQTVSVEAKARWSTLTETAIKKLEGKRDQWVGSLRAQYCIVMHDARKSIDAWYARTQPGHQSRGS